VSLRCAARRGAARWRPTLTHALADSYGKFQANTLIKRYNEPLFKPFYGLLTAQEEAKRGEHREELFKVLRAMDADLAGFTGRGGPFFFGEQFTLVDALVTPFLERMDALLPHYRGVDVLAQPELCNVKRFFEAAAARESVKTTRAPRTQLSLQTQPYFETERRPYLIEVYSAYAKGTLAEDQKRLANVRPPLAPADWGAEMPK
jgi:glutathione S-transferase